jgi:hypothetical protein
MGADYRIGVSAQANVNARVVTQIEVSYSRGSAVR